MSKVGGNNNAAGVSLKSTQRIKEPLHLRESQDNEVVICYMDDDTQGKISPKDPGIPANRYNTAHLAKPTQSLPDEEDDHFFPFLGSSAISKRRNSRYEENI